MRKTSSVLAAVVLIAGCAGTGSISSFNDAAGATYLAIGSASDLLYSLCRNEVPGGDCMPGTIATEDAHQAADELRRALATVSAARELYIEGDQSGAMGRLQDARRLVQLAETIVRQSQADDERITE